MKSDRILALDIGASGLKIAEFLPLKSGGVELVNYAIASLGIDPQHEEDRSRYIVTTLREAMRERNIKPGFALISVSGQSVFSRFVKLPPVEPEKVFQIVQYEAQQNVPFPIDEVVWDYQLVGGQEGELDVMLAAIKGEIIEELTDCVEFAGLVTDLVDVAPMAVYNAMRYNYGDLAGCTLVVDMGARSTDLVFVEEARVFSRSIPVAGNAITQQIMREFDLSFHDAEEMKKAHAFVAWGGAYETPQSEVADKVSKCVRTVMTRMHAEINRSINFYRSQQNGRAPGLVLLTGGTSIIPYTDTFLRDKLQVDVDYLNPFKNVAVSNAISADEIGRSAHLLSEVVGLALRRVLSCPIELNLMPPRIMAEKAFHRKEPLLLVSMICLILSVVVWCGYFFKMTGLRSERRAKVQSRVTELEAIERRMTVPEREAADVRNQIDQLHGLLDRRTAWVSVLSEVRGFLPEGMWLTSIVPQIEDQKAEEDIPVARGRGRPQPVIQKEEGPKVLSKIEISGLGYIDKIESANPILAFRDSLRQSDFFSEETEIRWQPAPGPDDVVREFKILLVLAEPIAL
ncbi:MAG: type IV pilus assembly protein PilM [Verrucomicrobia bacterium]|nr:type IV pilus assembly protein PilM [Verrucomicrobiota bacterium]